MCLNQVANPLQNPWATTGTDGTGQRLFPQFPLKAPNRQQEAVERNRPEALSVSGTLTKKRKRDSDAEQCQTLEKGDDPGTVAVQKSENDKRSLRYGRIPVSRRAPHRRWDHPETDGSSQGTGNSFSRPNGTCSSS